MEIPRRKLLRLAAGAAAIPAMSPASTAQDYPARPIHLIVGFPAGTAPDVIARRNIEGKVMFTNTKMTIAAALVVASISGASAQSDGPSVGGGNIASYHQVTPAQAGRGALGAYARVRRVRSDHVIRRGGGGNPPPNWYERNRDEFRGRW
jgi:hypothetical protein